jgi:hypothetical protein
MIRKKHALGPRPDGWTPVFPRAKAERVCAEIMLKKMERDPEKWTPVFRKRSCSKKMERDFQSTPLAMPHL